MCSWCRRQWCWQQTWPQRRDGSRNQCLPRRGHAQCGHLLKQKAKSAASERWMALRLCWNNKGICIFSTCCIPVGKIKMRVFSQVFITDLIFNSGADCGRIVVWFMLWVFSLNLQRASPRVLGRKRGRHQCTSGQPVLISNHLLRSSVGVFHTG